MAVRKDICGRVSVDSKTGSDNSEKGGISFSLVGSLINDDRSQFEEGLQVLWHTCMYDSIAIGHFFNGI